MFQNLIFMLCIEAWYQGFCIYNLCWSKPRPCRSLFYYLTISFSIQIILSGFDSKLNKEFYQWSTDLGIEIVKEVIIISFVL